MKQYYLIYLESEFIYDESKKIIVNSTKELKDYMKKLFDFYYDEYFSNRQLKRLHNEHLRDPHRISDLFHKIKYVYKRLDILNLTKESEDPTEKGFYYRQYYKNRQGDIWELLEIWAEKIPKNELYKFANFKELNEN